MKSALLAVLGVVAALVAVVLVAGPATADPRRDCRDDLSNGQAKHCTPTPTAPPTTPTTTPPPVPTYENASDPRQVTGQPGGFSPVDALCDPGDVAVDGRSVINQLGEPVFEITSEGLADLRGQDGIADAYRVTYQGLNVGGYTGTLTAYVTCEDTTEPFRAVA